MRSRAFTCGIVALSVAVFCFSDLTWSCRNIKISHTGNEDGADGLSLKRGVHRVVTNDFWHKALSVSQNISRHDPQHSANHLGDIFNQSGKVLYHERSLLEAVQVMQSESILTFLMIIILVVVPVWCCCVTMFGCYFSSASPSPAQENHVGSRHGVAQINSASTASSKARESVGVKCFYDGGEEQHAITNQEFKVMSFSGEPRSFRWIPPIEVEATRLALAGDCNSGSLGEFARHYISGGGSADLLPAPWSAEVVEKVLSSHDIDVSSWSPSKVQALVKELTDGRSFLAATQNGNGALRRTMEMVAVIVYHPTTGHIIVADDQVKQAADSYEVSEFRRQMKKGEKTLSIRKLPMEMVEQTAYRCIKEKMGIEDGIIQVTDGMIKTTEMEETSDFYPGLTTIVFRHMIQAKVVTTDAKKLKAIGADPQPTTFVAAEQVYRGEMCRWVWQSLDKIPELRQYSQWLSKRGDWRSTSRLADARASRTMRKADSRAALGRRSLTPLRESLQIVLPWDEHEVKRLLDLYQVTSDDFGMSLQELSSQAEKGGLVFGTCTSDGKLVAITDYIVMHFQMADSQHVLVETSNDTTSLQFPEISWHIDEGCYDAAKRLAHVQLFLDDEALLMSSNLKAGRQNLDSGTNRVMKREWILSAMVKDEAAANLVRSAKI
eukprot:gnl/MRDRNA2_/MRDRNA2_118995_c0_seq1.p1 gnl/MRDRNA2_/MRDRNA2_118995_c0~~gnl/MRDRNA2_/MRDRNA2_118995_c0_seq1.p1  ORF type:complete len:664 (-),score=115.64 gnl/MRDRNA2_/MRDRNA2_118995_c0_seq1:34-2025(-)